MPSLNRYDLSDPQFGKDVQQKDCYKESTHLLGKNEKNGMVTAGDLKNEEYDHRCKPD